VYRHLIESISFIPHLSRWIALKLGCYPPLDLKHNFSFLGTDADVGTGGPISLHYFGVRPLNPLPLREGKKSYLAIDVKACPLVFAARLLLRGLCGLAPGRGGEEFGQGVVRALSPEGSRRECAGS
jgi:hypothetical protein